MYSKVLKGELPVMKGSKRLYFSRTELMEYVKAGRKKSNAKIKKNNNIQFETHIGKIKEFSVDWFYDIIKTYYKHDGDLLEIIQYTRDIAKERELKQLRDTWNAAVEAYLKSVK